jgi:hypothetical protein|tara:strand:- start:73 stop:498 length:426 start_codon:yes stop_codon:yes gene_type:complete
MISDSRIHKDIINLSVNHFLSLNKIKEWYKYNEERRKDLRKLYRKDKKYYIELDLCEGYLKDMRHYLTHGDWVSNYYGKEMEHKISWTVLHSKKGIPYPLSSNKNSTGLEDLTDKEYRELKNKARRIELGLPFNNFVKERK